MPLTNYYRNKLIDWAYRGQAYTPGTVHAALLVAASASSYTEQTGGGVARIAMTQALATWAGTQGDGTTVASSGTSGTTSNNASIQFAATASAEISASYVGLFDAASGGNLLQYVAIRDSGGTPITRTWYLGDPVLILAAALRITWT